MNTATFCRTRLGLAGWLISPPVFIFLLNYVGVSQNNFMAYQVTKERQLAKIIPLLEEKVNTSSEYVEQFSRTRDGTDRTAGHLTTLFHQMAQQHAMDILSMETAFKKPEGGALPDTLVLRVRSEASLPSIIACIDDLKQRDQLFDLQLANLKIRTLYPKPRYTADFTLTFHAVSNETSARNRAPKTAHRLDEGGHRGPG